MSRNDSLHEWAYKALLAQSIEEKLYIINHMWDLPAAFDGSHAAPLEIEIPGQPGSLRYVHPRAIKQRRLSTEEGRACFLHAIAHIEFNAVNLALDAIYRFRDLPPDYYRDWLRVALEEVSHHQLLAARMGQLGYAYGDFPVHKGLWDIANSTSGSLLRRMALVPCVLEARGLDVTPPMIEKLTAIGDHESADVLKIILDQEVEHVAIGIRWYKFACYRDNIDPVDQFVELVRNSLPNRLRGPLNIQHRLDAGFTSDWLERLSASPAKGSQISA